MLRKNEDDPLGSSLLHATPATSYRPDADQLNKWQIARKLFEHHAVSLIELAALSGLDRHEFINTAQAENWQINLFSNAAGGENKSSANLVTGNINALAKSLAEQTGEILAEELALLKVEKRTGFSETRTKALLTITKGIQSLEEFQAKMEAALDVSSQYSSDILEFHQQLERQIEALANAPVAS